MYSAEDVHLYPAEKWMFFLEFFALTQFEQHTCTLELRLAEIDGLLDSSDHPFSSQDLLFENEQLCAHLVGNSELSQYDQAGAGWSEHPPANRENQPLMPDHGRVSRGSELGTSGVGSRPVAGASPGSVKIDSDEESLPSFTDADLDPEWSLDEPPSKRLRTAAPEDCYNIMSVKEKHIKKFQAHTYDYNIQFQNMEECAQYDPTSKSGGLFTEYVSYFLKIKVENSGIPKWCKNEADIEKFIQEYEEKEGIVLKHVSSATRREGVCKPNLNGVTLDDLGDAETVFEINVQAYSLVLREDGDSEEVETDDQGRQLG
ncbi:uncharacterized protein LOC110988767 [Acanthaster planci]|uniref:Uncharacterized protein LOC110988767 n=1 Tax=Acanthaster planci TaxID=133434 RepID=A0A8B7ZS75_ACAPL|nr:uncharacterized protein LOC110988767 [Acanthaster planci]